MKQQPQHAWCSRRGPHSLYKPRERTAPPPPPPPRALLRLALALTQSFGDPLLAPFAGLPSKGPLSSDWPQGSALPSCPSFPGFTRSPPSLEHHLYTICRICDHDLNKPRLSHFPSPLPQTPEPKLASCLTWTVAIAFGLSALSHSQFIQNAEFSWVGSGKGFPWDLKGEAACIGSLIVTRDCRPRGESEQGLSKQQAGGVTEARIQAERQLLLLLLF